MPSAMPEKQRLLVMFRRIQKAMKLDSMKALASTLGVERQTIYLWCKNEKVPAVTAIELERLLAETDLPLTRATIAPYLYY